VFGPQRYADLPSPSAGAEDFSRVLQAVPGRYLFLGARTGDAHDEHANNHSPGASFSDDVIPDWVRLHAQLAIRALRRNAVGAEPGTSTISAATA
jgi:metal-dependent amidase/aminoacylase/carboxypeptidase family protein